MSTSNGSPAAPAAIPDAARLREIAVKSETDPRTVAKWFEDVGVRPSVARRIERAVRELESEGQAAAARQVTQASTREAAQAAGMSPGVADIAARMGWFVPAGMHL